MIPTIAVPMIVRRLAIRATCAALLILLVLALWRMHAQKVEAQRVAAANDAAISALKLVGAELVPQARVQAAYEAGFAGGKQATEAGMKAATVTRWRTQVVEVDGPEHCDPEQALQVSAEVTEAQLVRPDDHSLWLDGHVAVHLAMPGLVPPWAKDVELDMERKDVSYLVAAPEKHGLPDLHLPSLPSLPALAAHRIHVGKGCVVGPAVYAGIQGWPTASAGVGAGVALACGWGIVK